jgi:hypothetical protein
VLVPKTAMNENSFAPADQSYVRPPWEIASMQPITHTESPEYRSDGQLWFGVLGADRLHDCASLFGRATHPRLANSIGTQLLVGHTCSCFVSVGILPVSSRHGPRISYY